MKPLRMPVQFNKPQTTTPTPKKSHWLELMNTIYPLPPAPAEQCRDAYIRNLASRYDEDTEETEAAMALEEDLGKIKFGLVVEMNVMDAEENILRDHIMHLVKPAKFRRPTGNKTEIRPPVLDINKLLKERYGSIASSIGFMGVLYQFQQLRERLVIVRELWSMTANIDKSLRMFSWSIKDYYFRFNQPNVMYLDTFELKLQNKMECYKFRTDIREVIRLVDDLCEDFLHKRDICKNSLVTLRDAQLDIKELLTTSQEEAARYDLELTITKHKTPRSADPDRSRSKAINEKINYYDFYMPIESRYRIKWAQTTMEQTIMYSDLQIKKKTDELEKLSADTTQMNYLWSLTNMSYEIEINKLKARITETEILYDEELERAVNIIQLTQSKLAKAKEDLQFYKDQIPIFYMKIAQVQENFAKQEAARESARQASIAKSIGKKRKSKQKKKK